MTTHLIPRVPSLIIACDVATLDLAEALAIAAEQCYRVGALKIGHSLVGRFGMGLVVDRIRAHTSVPIIYDHQKGGTDIPDQAEDFAAVASPVDAAILFPMAGPESQRAYTEFLQASGKTVLVGAEMTHRTYPARGGGYVTDDSPERILELAIQLGVRDFVVPATKPEALRAQRAIIERHVEEGDYTLYAPGLIAQGGSVASLVAEAGPRWHAIVGRAIIRSKDFGDAIATLASGLP